MFWLLIIEPTSRSCKSSQTRDAISEFSLPWRLLIPDLMLYIVFPKLSRFCSSLIFATICFVIRIFETFPSVNSGVGNLHSASTLRVWELTTMKLACSVGFLIYVFETRCGLWSRFKTALLLGFKCMPLITGARLALLRTGLSIFSVFVAENPAPPRWVRFSNEGASISSP